MHDTRWSLPHLTIDGIDSAKTSVVVSHCIAHIHAKLHTGNNGREAITTHILVRSPAFTYDESEEHTEHRVEGCKASELVLSSILRQADRNDSHHNADENLREHRREDCVPDVEEPEYCLLMRTCAMDLRIIRRNAHLEMKAKVVSFSSGAVAK